MKSPRFALHKALLQLPGAQSQDYTEQVDDVLALIADTYRSDDGEQPMSCPGRAPTYRSGFWAAAVGRARAVAGKRGLRFAANYHVAPATVLEAADGYRAAFRPSAELDRPHVAVSADVVVADDEATARDLAAGYGLWVRSIRTGEGAIQFPTPDAARAYPWTEADQQLVADRVETQFVGSAVQVADQLERLRDATEADELIITTITTTTGTGCVLTNCLPRSGLADDRRSPGTGMEPTSLERRPRSCRTPRSRTPRREALPAIRSSGGRCGRGAEALADGQAGHRPRNHQALDFAGSLEDGENLCIPVHSLHG